MNEHPADRLAIAVAQLNPVVGDVTGNLERARAARAQAGRDGADIIAFSELFIAGYPPEDLVLKPAFQGACRAAVETLARETADGGPGVLIGTPWVEDKKLYNAYALLAGGARLRRSASKWTFRITACLTRSGCSPPGRCRAQSCQGDPRRHPDLRRYLGTGGGRVRRGDGRRNSAGAERFALLARQDRGASQHRVNRVVETGLPLIYVNQVGGQDELVFDGASFAVNADRSIGFQHTKLNEVDDKTRSSLVPGTFSISCAA